MFTFLPEKHYPNAPITEAVIDITLELPEGVSVSALELVSDELYPHKEAILFNEVQFAGSTTTTKHQPLGWRFGMPNTRTSIRPG